MSGVGGEGGMLIAEGLSVGDFEGVKVGSFDRGAMVGDPSGKAGQNVGQAFAISSCGIWLVLRNDIRCETYKCTIHNNQTHIQSTPNIINLPP